MRELLEILMQLIKHEGHATYKFGLNLCIRVNFTGGSINNQMLGTGSVNLTETPWDHLMAHVSIVSFVNPGPNPEWMVVAQRLTQHAMDRIPRCMFSWKTEWHYVEVYVLWIYLNYPAF